MILVISIMACATVAAAILGLVLREERSLVRARLESMWASVEKDPGNFSPELAKPFWQRVIAPWLDKIAQIAKMLPINLTEISAKLERAGNPRHMKATEFAGLKVISTVGFAAAGLAISLSAHYRPVNEVVAVICAMVAGYVLPDALLERAARTRQRTIQRSLADCFDLLVVTTEAGLGFDGALARMVNKMGGPISDEFRKVLEDMSVGRSRTEAMRLMATRVGLAELTTMVAAIHQADLLGVSIAQVLRVQTETLRSQRNLRARQEAAKLPVKMLFPLVFFVFPAIFTVILLPGAIAILHALQNTY